MFRIIPRSKGKSSLKFIFPVAIHTGGAKIYHDLKRTFWWEGIKGNVDKVLAKCLNCQQVKAEHRKTSGLYQLLVGS